MESLRGSGLGIELVLMVVTADSFELKALFEIIYVKPGAGECVLNQVEFRARRQLKFLLIWRRSV